MQRKETGKNFACLSCFFRLVKLFYYHAAVTCEGAIVHFADTAKTMITLCMKDLKMFGLETNFESTRPIPHNVETKTKTISLSSRPRPRPRPQKIGLETYITGTYRVLGPNVVQYFLQIAQTFYA